MDVAVKEQILAIVTEDKEKVLGSVPIFIAKNDQEAQRLCIYLSNILKGMTHDLDNGVYVIVKH